VRRFMFILGIALGLCASTSAFGQDAPQYEIFGGYSYLNADTNNLASPSRQSANGWEASVSWNYNKWFAAEGDFSGYYKSDIDVPDLGGGTASLHDFAFAPGPRINIRPAFFHALVGFDHLTGSAFGFSRSQDNFAAAFGGGIQWKVAPRWAVRASADYVLTRPNIYELLDISGPAMTQNNFRASVGVVYLFGSTREPAPRTEQKTVASQPCAGSSEVTPLGVVGCGTDTGLRVTSVQSGSPAAQVGIVPGDIIASIDGRPVHNSNEIETAIAASTSGTIKIGYLIQGNWLTEREAKVR
jgi:Outer membrane protein beta-barrel domain/PDZ domain